MNLTFGTDGVRGLANAPLTPEYAVAFGRAVGAWICETGASKSVVIGRDTRRSGPMLGAALAAGVCSIGVDVTSLGVVPTGCVSRVAKTGGFGVGLVVSASHNPAPDNGIKLFGADGGKAPAEVEQWVESAIAKGVAGRPTGAEVGELRQDRSAVDAYVDWLESIVPEGLDGLLVVVDAGHGAAYSLAEVVLNRLGADVIPLGVLPDGMNINAEGGATKPRLVQDATRESRAAIGIAFDGDADRAVFSDSEGRLINGDRTMAIWAGHWADSMRFDPKLVVGTVMTNGALEAFLGGMDARLERVDVGDKHVSARLRETGGKIGGEQSGHIIFSEWAPTGDGLVTALETLRVVKRTGNSAAELYETFEAWPQLLVNVKVDMPGGFAGSDKVQSAIASGSGRLGDHGRVNVRASGTQPMVRVMVEADVAEPRDEVSQAIVDALLSEFGGEVVGRVDLTHALGD